jgi:asparagine N-glycosylation enzyme membrane subunit Stt3
MEQRYRALRTIASIYRVLGYIVLVLTILVFLAICGLSVVGSTATNSIARQYGGTGAGIIGGIFVSISALIYGGIMAISLIGISEAIYLLIAVEENTRRTAYILGNQNKPPAAPGPEKQAMVIS